MEHIDDYDLFDKDFEKFVQLGREAFGLEGEGCQQSNISQMTKVGLGSNESGQPPNWNTRKWTGSKNGVGGSRKYLQRKNESTPRTITREKWKKYSDRLNGLFMNCCRR